VTFFGEDFDFSRADDKHKRPDHKRRGEQEGRQRKSGRQAIRSQNKIKAGRKRLMAEDDEAKENMKVDAGQERRPVCRPGESSKGQTKANMKVIEGPTVTLGSRTTLQAAAIVRVESADIATKSGAKLMKNK
jgi:hypothetical protein